MAQHSMEIVPSLQILRDSIPDELEDAILRALEKVPADRFPTASQFIKAIEVAGTGTASHRLSRARQSRTHHPAVGRGRSRRILVWSLLAAVPLLAAAGWLWAGRGGTPASDGSELRSIAVLYFQDRSRGQELQHVADGFTDALIHDLSGITALSVISRNGVLPYKGQVVPPDSIGRALRVGTLVDGTITESDGVLRLSVSLINASTGKEIAGRVLERPRKEVFQLQDELAAEVSQFLRTRLGQEVQLLARQGETGKADAWETYQRGQELLNDVDALVAAGDGSAAVTRLTQADSLFARSEELDGNWLRPIIARGWVAYRVARSGAMDRDRMVTWLSQSMGHADRALSRQAAHPEALELRGTVRYFMWLLSVEPDQTRRDALLRNAETDLRAAVEGDPARAVAWNSLSHMMVSRSDNAEGKLAALKAYEADPYLTSANLTVWRIFTSSFELNDPVESRHWCSEGLRRFPEDPRFQECQLMSLVFKAEPADIPGAWAVRRRMTDLTPAEERDWADREARMLIAAGLARAGFPDSARSVALGARAGAAIDPTRDLSLFEAIARTILNDRDEAIRLLGEYLAVNPARREYMAKDPGWYFADLREDPRFVVLVGSRGPR
jgi:serine/threonine-protein kinase